MLTSIDLTPPRSRLGKLACPNPAAIRAAEAGQGRRLCSIARSRLSTMLSRLPCTPMGAWGLLSCTAAASAAATASRGAAAGFASSASSQRESAPNKHLHIEEKCLYAVLGVQPGVTQAELKAAFRKRAKELHPDASPDPSAASAPAFVQLLAAYKVLSNPRSRQLYDLSRDAAGPRVLRAAAAAGVQGAADAAYEETPVDLSWGLDSILRDTPKGGGALDHMRQELQGELHSAMRRAYLGPKLRPEELEAGWLPDAFEADERATSDCPDLLQLVSGRQVLGVVRERRAELLARTQAAAAAELGESRATVATAAALTVCGSSSGARPGEEGPEQGLEPLTTQQQGWQGQQQQQRQQDVQQGCQQQRRPQQGQQQQDARQGPQGQQQARQQQVQQQREPDHLDLFVGEQLVATAVRHFPRAMNSSSSSGTAAGSKGSARTGQEQQGQAEQDKQQRQQPPQHNAQQQQRQEDPGQAQEHVPPPLPAEVIGVYCAASGRLLAQVEVQQLDPGSATASSARLLDARGRHTHTVYRSQTPLVRHLTFAAEPGATGLRTRRPSRLVVCRMRRAWLPPSSLWLFKPVSYSHDVGGWYLEWTGQEQRDHPAVLHPAVFVLTAAFDSLDHERAARQPLGLFARLRAARNAEGACANGVSAQEEQGRPGWRGWLSSVLRFHGRG